MNKKLTSYLMDIGRRYDSNKNTGEKEKICKSIARGIYSFIAIDNINKK